MPSPEGRGGPPHQGEPSKEQEQQPYYLAAWFYAEPSAEQTYFHVRQLLSGDERADLSVYRFLLNEISHLVVIGAQPPEDLDGQLRSAMSTGEPILLPSTVVKALHQIQYGFWIEGHYRPDHKADP